MRCLRFTLRQETSKCRGPTCVSHSERNQAANLHAKLPRGSRVVASLVHTKQRHTLRRSRAEAELNWPADARGRMWTGQAHMHHAQQGVRIAGICWSCAGVLESKRAIDLQLGLFKRSLHGQWQTHQEQAPMSPPTTLLHPNYPPHRAPADFRRAIARPRSPTPLRTPLRIPQRTIPYVLYPTYYTLRAPLRTLPNVHPYVL